MDSWQALIDKVILYGESGTQEIVQRAFDLAAEAHVDRKRLDGTPYIDHAVEVAEILASWRAPVKVVVAGLLHDVLREEYSSKPSRETIRDSFGTEIAGLVQEVASLRRYDAGIPSRWDERRPDNIEDISRRLPWVAHVFQREPMAVVIKIADRLVNFRSLQVLPLQQQKVFADTVRRVFMPFADRLGMRAAKRELEDNAFSILESEKYQQTKQRYLAQDWEGAEGKVLEQLRQHLAGRGFAAQVLCAPASLYSLYRNEIEQSKALPLHVSRPLLILPDSDPAADDRPACYQALMLVHAWCPPLPHEMRDYIFAPKLNGYRGLRTRVRYEQGVSLVVLIRAQEMHIVAEQGVLAEELGVSKMYLPQKLPKWQDPKPGKIVVFTPEGEQRILPEAATPVDFAYALHHQVGNNCIGAIVNGRMVRLSEPLQSGDTVKILLSSIGLGPQPGWLNFVKSSSAKNAIRRYLQAQDTDATTQAGWNILDGKLREQGVILSSEQASLRLRAVSEQLKYDSTRYLLMEVGLRRLQPEKVVRQMLGTSQKEETSQLLRARIVSLSQADVSQSFGRCCHPQPPDPIVGCYLTKKNQVVIHKMSCGHVRRHKVVTQVEWDITWLPHQIEVEVIALNRVGLVRDVSGVLAEADIDVTSFHADRMEDGSARMQIGLGMLMEEQLNLLLTQLRLVRDVRAAQMRPPSIPSQYSPHSIIARHFANPYTKKPVYDEGFYGRDRELRELMDKLRLMLPGEAVLLWGPKRIGKTSLLLRLKSGMPTGQGYIPIFVDMQRISGTTPHLLYTIAEAIAKELGDPRIHVPNMKKMLRDPLGCFQSFLTDLRRFESGSLLLLLDEFQRLSLLRADQVSLADTFTYFRSLIQHGDGLSFIFSGGGVLGDLLKQTEAASLLNVTQHQKVGCLDPKDAERLIIEPVTRVEYEQEAVMTLLDVTACHPFYIQILCEQLISWADKAEQMKIKRADVEDVLENWLPEQEDIYFEHLWGAHSGIDGRKRQQNLLTLSAIADGAAEHPWVALDYLADKGIGSAMREADLLHALRDLVAMDTLELRQDESYRIKVPLCQRWLKARYPLRRLIKEFAI